MSTGSTTDEAKSRLALQCKAGNMTCSNGATRASEAPTDRLSAELKPRQEKVEASLQSWLSRVTATGPGTIHDAMAYSLFSPGKRLRPLLVILACEATGGTLEVALPSACAVEMIHTYSLIHDDLPAMDDDDLRRGQPTCHKKFGEALAILAGDALLTAAFEVIATGYPPCTAAVSCLELAKGSGAVGMVGGQVIDLQAEGRIGGQPTPQPPACREGEKRNTASGSPLPAGRGVGGVGLLEDLHARKTGALFRSSLRLGVFAAQGERAVGPDPKALAAVDAYAAAFGLLFQVTDDLLDVESTADKTGKRVGKDAARGKLTYPVLLGVEESRRKAAELGQQAVASAEVLGSTLLADLARYIVQRDR
jgi:geranylgeranyl diphosphate synthase, type II